MDKRLSEHGIGKKGLLPFNIREGTIPIFLDMDVNRTRKEQHALIYLAAVIAAVIFSMNGLMTPAVEGLDSSHNVMDGLFFYDLLRQDLWHLDSLSELIRHPVNYHEQYPALGFIYWPPFWPVVESLFFLIGGPSLFAAQLSVTLFTVIFSVSFVAVARRFSSPLIALGGLACLLTNVEIWFAANTIMRDMPALGMMMLTFWVAIKWQESHFQNRWLMGLVTVAVLSLYTKQTSILVHLSIALALLATYPQVLKQKSIWGAFALCFILTLPLIIFTFTVGSDNLGQSFGSDTQAIMVDYQGIDRWSLDSWLYYPIWLWQQMPAVVLAATLGLYFMFKPAVAGQNHTTSFAKILTLIWIISFYILFSFFDNKSFRFGSLWLPPIVLFACFAVNRILEIFNSSLQQPKQSYNSLWSLAIILLLAAPNLPHFMNATVPKMSGVDRATRSIVAIAEDAGNLKCVGYLGNFKQVFAQSLRRQDEMRRFHLESATLQDITTQTSQTCPTLVVELDQLSNKMKHSLEQSNETYELAFESPALERELLVVQTSLNSF